MLGNVLNNIAMTLAYHNLLSKVKSRMTLEELDTFKRMISCKIREARTRYNISATARLSYKTPNENRLTMDQAYGVELGKHLDLTITLLNLLLVEINGS